MGSAFTGGGLDYVLNLLIDLPSPQQRAEWLRDNIHKHPEAKEMLAMAFDKYGYKPAVSISMEDAIANTDVNATALKVALLAIKKAKGRDRKAHIAMEFVDTHGIYIVPWLKNDLSMGVGKATLKKVGVLDGFSLSKGIAITEDELVRRCDRSSHMLDLKLNGFRLSCQILGENTVLFKTYNGSVLEIPTLEKKILAQPNIKLFIGWSFDGELRSGKGRTEEDRIRVIEQVKYTAPFPLGDMSYVIYDVVPNHNINRGLEYTEFDAYARRVHLHRTVAVTTTISIIEWWDSRHTNVRDLLNTVRELGYEGIVGKPFNGAYTCKKSYEWLKVKFLQEASFKVIGFKPHTTKQGWIGSLKMEALVSVKGEVRHVLVSTGSGMNDADRVLPYEAYDGRVFEVAFLDFSSNSKLGTYSVTNPRFIKRDVKDGLLLYERTDCTSTDNTIAGG